MRRIAPLAVLVAAIAAAPARATLVYDVGVTQQSVWAAGDDGSNPHLLAAGSNPTLSPDGRLVAYITTGSSGRPNLMVVPADGSAPPRLLATGWRDVTTFAWSPDSASIATVTGPEVGRKSLSLIDVADADQTTITRGYFAGVSFAPDGGEIVFARATRERGPWRGDIYSVPAAGGRSFAITHDHRSERPLWSPGGQIAFVRLVDAKRRRYGPKNELYLMAPDGTGVRRLTYTHVAPLLFGLVPTQFSADGSKLLAEFEGQDTSYAVTVDPRTGAQRPIAGGASGGIIGTALSRDGATILGVTGGFDPSARHAIEAVPYAGGTPTTLVQDGFDPDWDR